VSTVFKPGDHIIFSFRPHCGRCRYCSSGQTVLCIGHNDTPRWRMHDGTARVRLNGEPVNQMARIGTFSEQVVCPAEQVVKIREDLPHTHAAIIGCSVATGIGAVIRHARVPAGSSVLVIGCGGVGLNVVQGARLAGANPIIACDLRDNKLGYAKTFGATHVINATSGDVVNHVRELGLHAAVEHIPGILHDIDPTLPHRLYDLRQAEVGHADVTHLALPHDVVERCHRLVEGRVGIGPMDEIDVDMVGLEPLQASVDRGRRHETGCCRGGSAFPRSPRRISSR